MDKTEIQAKIESLRELWKKEPANRRIIECRARALKMALEAKEDLAEVAQKIFDIK